MFEHLERRTLLASIIIDKGGTYSGTWENNADRTPVVWVRTTEPVVIQNSTIKGRGDLIYAAINGTNITVRNTKGYGLNPNELNRPTGRFVSVEGPDNLIVQDNYLESTRGIYVLGYTGNKTAAQTIKVTHNRAKNIDGRLSNGTGGWHDFNTRTHVTSGRVEAGWAYAQFLQLDKVIGVPNVEVAWNEVVNEVGKSRVEDNISIYKSSGTAASPISIHDNLIDGAYTLRPWQTNYTNGTWRYDWAYSGGGILLGDGTGTTINGDPAFVRAFGNTVISTTNYGIATASGRETEIYNNRVVSSGKLADGRAIVGQNVGIYVWDSYKIGATRFFDNVARNNNVGWINPATRTGRNDYWSPHAGTIQDNNLNIPLPITRQTELDEAAAWRARRYPTQTPPATGTIAGNLFKDVDVDGVRDANDAAAVGHTVWLDLDNDNVRDASEPTTKSSSTGRYTFGSLRAGKYVVRVAPTSGWRTSAGAAATLAVGDAKTTTRHFGVTDTGLVTGNVFMDANVNGTRDAAEAPLAKWLVWADANMNGVGDAGEWSTLTDANGNYALNLKAGNYQIRILTQANYKLIQPSSGYRSVTLTAGSIVTGRDFGEKRLT